MAITPEALPARQPARRHIIFEPTDDAIIEAVTRLARSTQGHIVFIVEEMNVSAPLANLTMLLGQGILTTNKEGNINQTTCTPLQAYEQMRYWNEAKLPKKQSKAKKYILGVYDYIDPQTGEVFRATDSEVDSADTWDQIERFNRHLREQIRSYNIEKGYEAADPFLLIQMMFHHDFDGYHYMQVDAFHRGLAETEDEDRGLIWPFHYSTSEARARFDIIARRNTIAFDKVFNRTLHKLPKNALHGCLSVYKEYVVTDAMHYLIASQRLAEMINEAAAMPGVGAVIAGIGSNYEQTTRQIFAAETEISQSRGFEYVFLNPTRDMGNRLIAMGLLADESNAREIVEAIPDEEWLRNLIDIYVTRMSAGRNVARSEADEFARAMMSRLAEDDGYKHIIEASRNKPLDKVFAPLVQEIKKATGF